MRGIMNFMRPCVPALSIVLLSSYWNVVTAQAPANAPYYSEATGYKTVNTEHYDSVLMNQHWWVELDLLLNPLYVSQFSSQYILNGQRLPAKPVPHFYALQPTQSLFSSIGEVLDQSNAIYVNFRAPWLERSKWAILHHTYIMVGITHDKLETGSQTVYYKYNDGGTELTLMLNKNITHRLSDLDFKLVNLLFSFNIQAGVFASLARVQTHMAWKEDTIQSANHSRWQFPNPRDGWGWLVSSNFEVGGMICRSCSLKHFGITAGARGMVEGLYSSDKVLVNGEPGYRLKMRNYGVFIAGPVINLKYINF